MSETTLLSVDLDDLACYHGIHGMQRASVVDDPVLERCLPRFLEVFDAVNVKATFFVVGRALERDLQGRGRGAQWLRQALREGHELANHTHTHPYDLVRWSPGAVRRDLERCDSLLRELGANPVGFRAPGYTHDDSLLAEVRRVGYRYDSSKLPSPSYYALKVAAIAGYRLLGRTSHSQLTGAGSFFGPKRPAFREDLQLWQVPISVGGWWRWPLIGTTLLSAPTPLRQHATRLATRASFFHLELHGLDLVDERTDPHVSSLQRKQPELWVSLAQRRDRLTHLLRARGSGTSIATFVAEADGRL